MPDGGGNGGDGSGSGDVEQLQAQLAAATAKAVAAEAKVKELGGKVGEAERELLSPEYLEFLDSRSTSGGKKPSDEGGKKGGEGDVDLEGMSKKELVEYILGLSRKELTSLKGELEERDTKRSKELGLAFAQIDMALAFRDHPEFAKNFDAHKEAFYAKAKENPKWGASRVIKEVERDVEDEAKAAAKLKEEETEKERKALTERESSPTDAHKRKQLSDQEAGELAYEKAFGTKTK